MSADVARFALRGVRFETVAGVTSVYGPEDDAALLDEVRAAVTTRMATYGKRLAGTRQRPNGCCFCGDVMAKGRSGDCALCRIAGQKLGTARVRAAQTGGAF